MKALTKVICLIAGTGLVMAGCAGDEASAADGTSLAAEYSSVANSIATLSGPGPWTATSTGGSHVTLTVEQVPLLEGPQSLRISVHSADPKVRPMSVDYTSPTMPTHGVMRVAVETDEGGVFVAGPHIPMSGTWALFVNLDDGADTAEFLLDFSPVPAEAGAHDHRGH